MTQPEELQPKPHRGPSRLAAAASRLGSLLTAPEGSDAWLGVGGDEDASCKGSPAATGGTHPPESLKCAEEGSAEVAAETLQPTGKPTPQGAATFGTHHGVVVSEDTFKQAHEPPLATHVMLYHAAFLFVLAVNLPLIILTARDPGMIQKGDNGSTGLIVLCFGVLMRSEIFLTALFWAVCRMGRYTPKGVRYWLAQTLYHAPGGLHAGCGVAGFAWEAVYAFQWWLLLPSEGGAGPGLIDEPYAIGAKAPWALSEHLQARSSLPLSPRPPSPLGRLRPLRAADRAFGRLQRSLRQAMDQAVAEGAASASEAAAGAAAAAAAPAPAAVPPAAPPAEAAPAASQQQQQRTLPALAARNALSSMPGGSVQWQAASSLGNAPKRYRGASSGRRQARLNAAAESSSATWSSFAWDSLDDAGAGLDMSSAAASAAASAAVNTSGSGSHSAVHLSNPWAQAQAAQQQQKWDEDRQARARSYIECLPGMRQFEAAQQAARRQALEDQLAAQQPCCSTCGSLGMEESGSVAVLYIDIDVRFEVRARRWRCVQQGCGGGFAPSPFSVGCFPATPKSSWDLLQASPAQPARWLSLRLLQLCDSLVYSGSRTASVHTLAKVVHRQHELNGCDVPLAWDHFRRQLADAIMEYGYLMCALMQLAALGVQDAPTGPLSGCPCCHGAQGIHINVDFCFQLCHLQRCGTSGVQLAPPNQQLYIDSAAASALLSSAGCRSADAAESDSAPCSDFDAAQALGRTSEKCDVTAVGATMCRHSIVAHLLDIGTGERYIYAAILLYTLMVHFSIPILVVWYDINCRFGPWFKRWAAGQPLLQAMLVAVATLLFPLPCFHRYSHSVACQERNDALAIPGVGRQYNEPVETLWSFLGVLGVVTQYMTHRNRQGRLERGGQLWNAQQAAGIVSLLCSMHARAAAAQQAAARGLAQVLQQLELHHGITREQALAKLAQRTVAVHAQPSTQLSPMAEYALLRLRRAVVSPLPSTAVGSLPPAVNLFNGSSAAMDKLAPGSVALARLDSRLRQLGSSLFEGSEPALDSPEFAAAVAELAQSDIQRLQASLTRSAQQVQLMEILIPDLHGRPGEQAKLRRQKQALKQRMQPDLNCLVRWLAGGYTGFGLLPAALRALSHTVSDTALWSVDGVCRGAYPWESCSAPATLGASPGLPALTAEQLLTQLQRRTNELQRATEELQLLASEQVRCLQYLQDQHAKIDAAVQRIGERRAALLSSTALPACTSIAARQPSSEVERMMEAEYCGGLLLLLEARLQKATAQLLTAQQAFTCGASGAVHVVVEEAMLDEENEEDVVM